MALANKIFIGIDDDKIELTGADKDAFIADREANNVQSQLREAEYQAKRDARESAIQKLAEIAGLTETEINAII